MGAPVSLNKSLPPLICLYLCPRIEPQVRKKTLCMKVVILDRDLDELLQTRKNKRYRKIERSKVLFDGLERAIQAMREAEHVDWLRKTSFLHYERLKHSAYRGKSSVRIANGAVERLIFTEHEDGIEVHIIELDDTHYGNKK